MLRCRTQKLSFEQDGVKTSAKGQVCEQSGHPSQLMKLVPSALSSFSLQCGIRQRISSEPAIWTTPGSSKKQPLKA